MKQLVIIGGGISGLAAATRAREVAAETGLDLEITVLEKDAEVGGKARSHQLDEWLVEGGPTAYLDNEPALPLLVKSAGIESLAADSAAAHRFLYRGHHIREIAAHPLKFARAGILSMPAMLRILKEPFVKRRVDESDESVFDFATRRLGRQAAERLIAPMALGVFAGDARRLSLASAFPKIRNLEDKYGSLFRGMKALKGSGGGPAGPKGTLTSFAPGLQELPRRLAQQDGLNVQCGVDVHSIQRGPDGRYRIVEAGRLSHREADAVVLATEAWSMSQLLGDLLPDAARELALVPYPPVIVVGLGYEPAVRAKVPQGFGVLVQRGEGPRILGCLWDSYLFPGRAPADHLLVRCLLGGAVDPSAAELTDEELVKVSRQDLRTMLGIDAPPILQNITRWERAIPQYEVGHGDRVARIEAAVATRPGLFLAGNCLRGVAFAKAAQVGWECGEQAISSLR